nr:zf-CCHC domain-containing protein [Tanacetum cinerariifolium]
IIEESALEVDVSHIEEVVYPDEREALVIRRNLNMVQVTDDEWLRNNIFYTQCTCIGKVCNVIIDGGSCSNVVATSMVEKLQLKTEDHPQVSEDRKIKIVAIKLRKHAGLWWENLKMRRVREDIIEESALEVDVSHIEEVVYPDEGEALVIWRNLNMVQATYDEWLRNNIFYTRCTCIGKGKCSSSDEESRSRILEHNPLVRTILEDFKDMIQNEIPMGLPPIREV